MIATDQTQKTAGFKVIPGGLPVDGVRGLSARSQLAELAMQMGDTAVREHLPLLELLRDLGVQPRDFVVAYQLAEAIDHQWGRFQKMLVRCRKDFSEESVHDARVHCRRLIARATLAGDAMRTSALDPVVRALKRFLKPLGALRDVQVQKPALTDELRTFPEVAGLWIDLGKREPDLIASASAWVARFRFEKLGKRLETFQRELTDPAARLAAKSTLHDAVVYTLEEAYREVMRRRQQINPARPATVHQVRIAYKRYRYSVESLPPAVGQASPIQLTAMGHYQTALGRIQDVEVLKGFVDDYRQRFPLMASGLQRFRATLLERRQALIEDYLSMADTFESFWPLASPPPSISP